MEAFILFPSGNYSGNLLWSPFQFKKYNHNLEKSLDELRERKYWASPFPEGDGVTFNCLEEQSSESIMRDFEECFDWAIIKHMSYPQVLEELAKIDEDIYIDCIVTVPLQKIKIEASFQLAENYKYFANEVFDTICVDRIADFKTEYIEFNLKIKYGDLIQLSKHSFEHDNYVINLCLDHAERGMDIVRLRYSSFKYPEFTPNPAGQTKDGFYEVQVTPNTSQHIPVKAKVYGGISRPLSASNNWLGPEVHDAFGLNDYKLSEILTGNVQHELGNLLISSLRNCRQAFYTLGEETKFLSLIFSIDGLATPKPDWKGWKHRSYIAVLACNGDPLKFEITLESYDYLYTEIRNKLVHEGKSFYELGKDNAKDSCEILWNIYKKKVDLILRHDFTEVEELYNYAINLLRQPSFQKPLSLIIHKVDKHRVDRSGNPKKVKIPKW